MPSNDNLMTTAEPSTTAAPVTDEPKPTVDISVAETAQAAPPPVLKKQKTRRRRVRSVFHVLGSIINSILTGLWILLVYVIPGGIFAVVTIGLMVGLSFGINAGYAAVALLIGNAILRIHLAHYTQSNGIAAAIGATGSVVAFFIIGIVSQFLPKTQDGQLWWPFGILAYTALMALSGTLGAAILRHNHVDLHGIDLLHATRAGALGGAILGPGSILAAPIILLGIGLILSPLFIAMKLGLRWVYVRSNETWDDRGGYKYSVCYSYGTCGHDSDIEEELSKIPRQRDF